MTTQNTNYHAVQCEPGKCDFIKCVLTSTHAEPKETWQCKHCGSSFEFINMVPSRTPSNIQVDEGKQKTVGEIITAAIVLHELNPDIVEQELQLPKGILYRLMSDDFYTNSIPVILFQNLLLSLHIPFKIIEPAILPTFRLLVSKETKDSIKKKPHGYMLWENEESVIKYTQRLASLFTPAASSEGTGSKVDLVKLDQKFSELFNDPQAYEKFWEWYEKKQPDASLPSAPSLTELDKVFDEEAENLADEILKYVANPAKPDYGGLFADDILSICKSKLLSLIPKLLGGREGDNWIEVKKQLPEFDKPVLCFCAIYGRYIGWYQRLENSDWGNWNDGKSLGVLPPTHWQKLPEQPKK